MMKYLSFIAVIAILFGFTGCGVADSKQLIVGDASQMHVRSYQTKSYEYSNDIVSRAVISAFQDLGFMIDKADKATGVVTATKLVQGASMRMTIVLRTKSESLTEVRTNAQFYATGQMPKAVDDPETYQAFFTVLDKAVFVDNAGI